MKRFLKTVVAIIGWYIGMVIIGIILRFITNFLLDHFTIKTTLGMIIFNFLVGSPFFTVSLYVTLFLTVLLERKTETIVYATIAIMIMIFSLLQNITDIPTWFIVIGVIAGGVGSVISKDETKGQ